MQSSLFLRIEDLNCTIDLADAPQTWDLKLDVFQGILGQHGTTPIHGMYFGGSYVCIGMVECPSRFGRPMPAVSPLAIPALIDGSLPQLFINSRSWPNANNHMSGITKIINPDRNFDGITSNIDF